MAVSETHAGRKPLIQGGSSDLEGHFKWSTEPKLPAPLPRRRGGCWPATITRAQKDISWQAHPSHLTTISNVRPGGVLASGALFSLCPIDDRC